MANNQDSGVIPPHGGYRDLQSYQMTEIIYDATVVFCNRFISPRSRTHDQMVQAARSSKQNIAANALLCLIHQANYLLDQQLRALEKEFLKTGGFTERLYQARMHNRQ